MTTAAWIAVAVAAAIVGYVVWTFNRFVGLRQRADGAFSDIDVQLKRRWDLVPSLVETVRAYAAHEQETLERTVAARSQAMATADAPAGGIAARGVTELTLAAAIRGIFGLVESYPDLKADQRFRDLHKTLVDIEDQIQYARRYYNAVVRDMNTLRQSFPANVVGGMFRVGEREFFQLDAEERAVPQVDLG